MLQEAEIEREVEPLVALLQQRADRAAVDHPFLGRKVAAMAPYVFTALMAFVEDDAI